MLKFSANVSMMFKEEPDPIKRMQLAKASGFDAVEYLYVYDMLLDDLFRESARNELSWSIINIAVGEGIKHGPLVAAIPGKQDSWKENVSAALDYCSHLKPAAAVIPAFSVPNEITKTEAISTFKNNLKYAGDKFAEIGTRLIIEPLNPQVRPNSLLTTSLETVELLNEIDHPNLGIEYDIYHMYCTEGEIEANVEKYLPYIGNIQIADVPGRHEPGTGEIDFDSFFAKLIKLKYPNWVACEYSPVSTTDKSLSWMKGSNFKK